MPDDGVISIETARMKRAVKNMETIGGDEEKRFVHELRFHITPSSVERLNDLQERLSARSHGQVIAAAVDILDACLKRIEDGKKIVAVDDEGQADDFVQDPRFEDDPEPKTPA